MFSRALVLDESLNNVWFNKAHAQLRMSDIAGATESLTQTLRLDPTNTAAKHMLKALSKDESLSLTSTEDAYVRDLFDSYATVYDSHVKKLLYSANRVIRQEMAKVYRAKYGFEGERKAAGLTSGGLGVESGSKVGETAGVVGVEGKGKVGYKPMGEVSEFKEAKEGAPVGSSCSTYSSFMNNTLDILDLGCGTGLAGAWLKDYAKTLVGVDLSEEMVKIARKKGLYQDLQVQNLNTYLDSCDKVFDLTVAADVLSYLGDLSVTFARVAKVVKPGGHFVFTVETASSDVILPEKGYKLLPSGTFAYKKNYIDDLIAQMPAFSITL